jgi:hypothetical protein
VRTPRIRLPTSSRRSPPSRRRTKSPGGTAAGSCPGWFRDRLRYRGTPRSSGRMAATWSPVVSGGSAWRWRPGSPASARGRSSLMDGRHRARWLPRRSTNSSPRAPGSRSCSVTSPNLARPNGARRRRAGRDRTRHRACRRGLRRPNGVPARRGHPAPVLVAQGTWGLAAPRGLREPRTRLVARVLLGNRAPRSPGGNRPMPRRTPTSTPSSRCAGRVVCPVPRSTGEPGPKSAPLPGSTYLG